MTHVRNPRILVFDSGVGGLSISAEIQRRLPACELIYASDNAAFPYGTKGEEDLTARVDKVLHCLLEYRPADIIVVACNTASTLTLPHIRRHFSQPVVGVVPAIKPAAAHSRTGVIGLLATPATVSRPYTKALIQEYAGDCEVISVGSSELVQWAERKLRGQTVPSEVLRGILEPFSQRTDLDTLVLACTHFPLLRSELLACLGPGVTLIDSGEAIARRVEYWLDTMALDKAVTPPAQHQCLFTRADNEIARLEPTLRQMGFTRLDYVNI